MTKRYGYRPQTVQTKHGELQIDGCGRVYQYCRGSLHRLNSIWLPHSRIVAVEIGNEVIELRATRDGFAVVERAVV